MNTIISCNKNFNLTAPVQSLSKPFK